MTTALQIKTKMRETNAYLSARLPLARTSFSAHTDERDLREEMGRLFDSADGVVASAKEAKRDLTAEEIGQVDSLLGEIEEIRASLTGTVAAKDEAIGRILIQAGGEEMGGATIERTERPSAWVDQHGKPVHVLTPKQKMVDLPTNNASLAKASIGEYIQARITGDHSKCSPAIKGALKEGDNSLGGFLVPSELGRRVIDLARAQSVIMKAGCQTVAMTSDSLTLARIASDPTFVGVGENIAITESSMTFDALNFTAHKIGTFISVSRELAEDAPNFVQLVEQALATAFAAKLDNIAVNGLSQAIDSGLLQMATSTGMGETTGASVRSCGKTCTARLSAFRGKTLNQMPTSSILKSAATCRFSPPVMEPTARKCGCHHRRRLRA